MAKLLKSEKLSERKECEALVNRNSEYRLSGDLGDYFLCAITGRACIGKIILDEDDLSSQFFSRAHAKIDMDALKNCASYGITKEELPEVIRRRKEKEAEDLINNL